MKKVYLLLFALVLAYGSVFAQSQLEILKDKNGEKILKGVISRSLLENDTSFKWYAENQKGFTPQSGAVAALRKNTSVEIIAFMGTWCEDSHFIIPKLYMLLDAAGVPSERVTILGVDRQKKTISHFAEAFNITNVPTIIVMYKGKEVGRVVEYGKGLFDKDLGEIVNAIVPEP